MKLIEREGFLAALHSRFSGIAAGEGHCVFVSGESGIGKTSLVKAFCKEKKDDCEIYQGSCDALFTPRPLAPLHDIIWQVNKDLWPLSQSITGRNELFSDFFRELGSRRQNTIIVFEDIHWADEATLDFIKFFARRITQLPCLFILTYRDDDIHLRHPLRNVLGQLSPDSFSRLQLTPLSRMAVETMSKEKGYRGEDVYTISGGIPFYVTEILSSYSLGVPESIKDAILSAYNRQEAKTMEVWDLLSVIPAGLETKYLEQLEPSYAQALERCIQSKILLVKDGFISFKHELFRRTIETSLSPLKRVALNRKILEILRESFEANKEIERIIHHAKNANEYDLVVHYAPLSAQQAAAVGAHVEASKLYLSAIEYYQGSDKDLLIRFYEAYAYECYLTNQIGDAIIYTRKSLVLWQEKNNIEKIGNCLRFLSRLWWFNGSKKNAESLAAQAIDTLQEQPSSSVKAMAFSNMAQLKMLSDDTPGCVFWGEKAIEMAKELNDEEILSHALNNVGTVQMNVPLTTEKGAELLQQSLSIALKNSYPEHVARAYTNLASSWVRMKKYPPAGSMLNEGIAYCEERDLDSWTTYMWSLKARMCMETGDWQEAVHISDNLLRNENQPSVIRFGAWMAIGRIRVRRGEDDALASLLEARAKAFEAFERQRIVPVMTGLLEYEWITGTSILESDDIARTIAMIEKPIVIPENKEFAFWLQKARKQQLMITGVDEKYDTGSAAKASHAAGIWEQMCCPYEQALMLFEGNDDDKRKAIAIMQSLGANAVYEKMKFEMRGSGIRSIPRGARKSTLSNAAQLTTRELDVLQLLKQDLQNKEIGAQLFISAKTVDHHISSILFKLDVNTRQKAVKEALRQGYI